MAETAGRPRPEGSAPGESTLEERRARLLADPGLAGSAWMSRYATEADTWLASVLEAATAGNTKGYALVAVGGYGRGLLAPGSDLDLVLVHDSKRHVKSVADAVWYPIWDSRIGLDHSVRTPREVRAAMDSDIKVALGWLDARLVAGDARLAEAAIGKATDLWRTRVTSWLGALDQVTRERHARFGDLAFLLEPDLKEARGGRRDVQLMQSLAAVVPLLAGAADDAELHRADEILAAVRVELQRPGGRSSNVLLLQDQDLVAAELGYADADVLMTEVAGAGQAIAWAADDAWRRLRSWIAGPAGRGGGGDHLLEPGIVLRDDEVSLLAGADPATDPALALRVAAASAEVDRPIARSTLDQLGESARAPEGVWPATVLEAFLRLLGAGLPAVSAIESLDQRGVWLRYLPEWAPVRYRPQRNAYHRFTIDRHLVETVAGAAALRARVSRPDLLLLGALFHDIGKGQGGDHTEVGIEIMGRLGPRMGLAPADVAVVENMIRHHLLLPEAATRRDLDDPATASAVAAACGDLTTLELLAALTEADSLATGPAAWGPWKAGLVAQLVERTAAILEGRPVPEGGAGHFTPEELALLATIGPRSAGGAEAPGKGRDGDGDGGWNRELALLAAGGRVTLAAVDHPGLLATAAGVLTLAGLNLRSANTLSDADSGLALLRFEVAPAFDRLPDWDKVRSEMAAALDGRLVLEELLAEREASYSRYRRPTAARAPEVRVTIDNDASASATVVEVRAPDRGPVLHQVTKAITDSGVTIICALVNTLGAEAIDVFYVQEIDGGQVTDPAHQQRLREAVLAEL